MDPRIENLKSTTFFGRRFTRQQIAQVQETVATFPALARKELAQTICEHLRWRTPAGKNRVAAGLGLLEALHKEGILTLPPKREEKMHGTRQPLARTPRTDPQPRIQADLRAAVYTQIGLDKWISSVPSLGHVRATPDSLQAFESRIPGARQGAGGGRRLG